MRHTYLGDDPVLDFIESSEEYIQIGRDLLESVSAERQENQFVLDGQIRLVSSNESNLLL